MNRHSILFALAIMVTGCMSAPASHWQLYAKANYLQGRLEAKGEALCGQKDQTPQTVEFCAEGRRAITEIRIVKPVIESELSASRPDMEKIMKYLDLVIGIVARVPIL